MSALLPSHPSLVVLKNKSLLALFTKIRNKLTSPGKSTRKPITQVPSFLMSQTFK